MQLTRNSTASAKCLRVVCRCHGWCCMDGPPAAGFHALQPGCCDVGHTCSSFIYVGCLRHHQDRGQLLQTPNRMDLHMPPAAQAARLDQRPPRTHLPRCAVAVADAAKLAAAATPLCATPVHTAGGAPPADQPVRRRTIDIGTAVLPRHFNHQELQPCTSTWARSTPAVQGPARRHVPHHPHVQQHARICPRACSRLALSIMHHAHMLSSAATCKIPSNPVIKRSYHIPSSRNTSSG
jgi:hypothetical protein